jgi:hypothetical protein
MRYQPLELGQPGNPKCPDKFTEDSTVLVPDSSKLLLQVSNQAIIVQLGLMPQGRGTGLGAVVWQAEDPFLPMIAALTRNFDALRIRNYTTGVEAQVLVSFV